MRSFHIVLVTLTSFLLLASCQSEQKSEDLKDIETDLIVLDDDLKSIPDSSFKILDNWLANYKILGFAEGDHGFNESLDFRNSYIKYLVKTNQIRILAFESGIIETQIVNDYINGMDLDLDYVRDNGMSYTFGQFEQSKELLMWLREENKTRSPKDRVQFYGFDMAGNASNPYLENTSFALKEGLAYLKRTDTETAQKFNKEFEYYLPFLNTLDSPESKGISFSDLPQDKRESLLVLVDDLISVIEKNKEQYVKAKGEFAYDWGLQAAKCAKQNVIFIEGYNATPRNQSSREKFMLDNLKWIMDREKGEKIFLFAHLAHLAKDIAVLDSAGRETKNGNLFGEHLVDRFGNDYKLVANTFSHSDYYTEIDTVKINSFPDVLNFRYDFSTFLLNITGDDGLYKQPQIFGAPLLTGDVWINPSKGIDVVLYTETQHFFYKE